MCVLNIVYSQAVMTEATPMQVKGEKTACVMRNLIVLSIIIAWRYM